jgi:hypothetical protein
MKQPKCSIIFSFLFYVACLEISKAEEWDIIDHHLNDTVMVDKNSFFSNGYYIDGSIKIRTDIDEGEYGHRHNISLIDAEIDCIKRKIHIEHFIQSTEESWWNGNDGKNDINFATDLLRGYEHKVLNRFCNETR